MHMRPMYMCCGVMLYHLVWYTNHKSKKLTPLLNFFWSLKHTKRGSAVAIYTLGTQECDQTKDIAKQPRKELHCLPLCACHSLASHTYLRNVRGARRKKGRGENTPFLFLRASRNYVWLARLYLSLMRVRDQSPKRLTEIFFHATKLAFVTTSVSRIAQSRVEPPNTFEACLTSTVEVVVTYL